MDNLNLPSANDIADNFLDFLHNNNITPKNHIDIIADGQIHRFQLLNDDSGEKSGAYCIYSDHWPIGWAEDWHVGNTIDWRYNSDSIPKDQQNYLESQEFKDKVEASKKKWEEQKIIQHNAAATKALDIFNNSDNAPEDNPYLQAKQISPTALKSLMMDGFSFLSVTLKANCALCNSFPLTAKNASSMKAPLMARSGLSLSRQSMTRTTLFFSARASLLWLRLMSLLANLPSPLSLAML